MGPNQPVYAKPITLPLPPVTNPLPLSPQQCQQLLFGSELEDQINAAITNMGELPFWMTYTMSGACWACSGITIPLSRGTRT